MTARSVAALLLLAVDCPAEIVATFTRDGVTDSRLDRFPALRIESGEPATPFLTTGPFQAIWKGKLVIPRRLRPAFSLEGEGNATLKIAGDLVLEKTGETSKSIRLNPGEHDFELAYVSKADGTAALRVYWEEAGFVRQTIPFSAFKAEASEATNQGDLHRAGRLAFAQQNCVKCHTSSAAPPMMPETMEFAPLLAGIGGRVTEDWLRRWIADPQAMKPGTKMPALVDASTDEGRGQSSDLAAFLLTLKSGAAAGPAPDPALARDGGVHFHELGCVGCHQMPDAATVDPARVPLNNVASKFLPGALALYLKKPDAWHPFSAMPDFKLSDAEAASIAAYLTEASRGKETKPGHGFPAGDATRGAKLAESLHCGSCHPGLPVGATSGVRSLEVIFTKDWSESGCAAPPEKRGKSPVLNFTDGERDALSAFAKTGAVTLSRDTAAEFATRQMESLRCTACHAMDDRQPLLDKVHGESAPLVAHLPRLEERVDQSRPRLTFAGEMLYTSYLESMLAGTVESRPRPWLAMRMPAFRGHAAAHAAGLSKLHGVGPNKPSAFTVDPGLAETGRQLAGVGGFGCVTCHASGDQKATAAFEVEGILFKLVPGRLREEFYHRWMDDPQAVSPATKMPRYSTGRKSNRADVLGGDARKQYEAIWHYLHAD